MGRPSKYIKSKAKKRVCATSILHDVSSAAEKIELKHANKIKVHIKRQLLGRIGKSVDYFTGSICTKCIDSVRNHEIHIPDAIHPECQNGQFPVEHIPLSPTVSEVRPDSNYMDAIDSANGRSWDISQFDLDQMETPSSPLVSGTAPYTGPVVMESTLSPLVSGTAPYTGSVVMDTPPSPLLPWTAHYTGPVVMDTPSSPLVPGTVPYTGQVVMESTLSPLVPRTPYTGPVAMESVSSPLVPRIVSYTGPVVMESVSSPLVPRTAPYTGPVVMESASSSTTPGTVSNIEPVIILSLASLRQDLDNLSAEVRSLVAYELAAGERARIRADTLSLSNIDNRDIDALHDICRVQYLQERNKVLANFVIGLWEEPTTQAEVQKRADIYKLAKVIESCMGLTTPIAVLPFHFREVVLVYSHTRSRTALELIASSGGCYQTIKNWLNKLGQSAEGTQLPSDRGDTACVFDNNQVLQQRWKICVDNRAVCSVITMVAFFDIDSEGTLQFQEELKPSHWMWDNLDEQMIAKLREGHLNAVHQQTKYVKHFHPWLTGIIQQVADEQRLIDGKCVDEVDRQVATLKHGRTFRSCPQCGSKTIPRAKKKCPSCKLALPSLQTNAANHTGKRRETDKKEGETRVLLHRFDDDTYSITYESSTKQTSDYDHLPDLHPKVPPGVTIGEPLFLNPCSYEAVAEVFRGIGRQAGIRRYGGTREWLTIVCDGLPYILGYQLIERCFVCELCGKSVQGLSERVAHHEEHQEEEPSTQCNYTQEFDWVLLQPGPGHVEMNMLKTYVKFTWPVFWEGMAERFNFRSEVAKKSAINVSDHHKGMTLAKIARESYAKELVLPYVRQELNKENPQLSVTGFLEFLKTVKSPNHHLMADLIFVILDSIFLYRAGLRSGDVTMIDAGRAIFARMWCARSHPLYRQLAVYDSIMTACMPPQVLEFINKTKSVKLTDDPYSGEGLDFKLEALNRMVQHWIPPNPTDKDWKHACINQPQLSKLKQIAESDMGFKDPRVRTVKSRADLQPEIMALRASIREREFLSNHDCEEPLTSFHKEPLDKDLVKFARNAAEKETAYINTFLNHKITGGFLEKTSITFKEAPIFVTPQERADYEDINNKTVSECTRIIHAKILEIEDEEMRKNFAKAFDIEIVSRKGKKKDYLDFYGLLSEYEMMTCHDTEFTEATAPTTTFPDA